MKKNERVIGTEADFSTRCGNNCGQGYSDAAMDQVCLLFNNNRSFTCRRCGHVHRQIADFTIWVRHDAAKFLNPNNIFNRSWFHATDDPDWFNHVTRPTPRTQQPMVHVGVEGAAVARAGQRYDEHLTYGYQIKQWYLYEVMIKPGTDVLPYVQHDMNVFPLTRGAARKHRMEWSADGATRYVNAYEQPGSISLMVNSSRLKFVNRTDLN